MPRGSASILKISVNVLQSLHKNWHFPFRTSLLNVNISAVFSRFVHSSYLPKKSLMVNFIFAVQFQIIFFTQTIPRVIMLSWGNYARRFKFSDLTFITVIPLILDQL